MGTSSVRSSAAVTRWPPLQNYGQSVWLDFIRATLISGGELQRMLDEDGLGGVTSNPAIFAKAIDGSDDYKAPSRRSPRIPSIGAKRVYELLAIKDIQGAADILRPVYDRTKAHDGYVSLEVAPDLASDTQGTLEEARRLWKEVDRPNVMIKVPATPEGVPAIRTLLTEGINVNVTLLFSKEAYEGVAQAFVEAIEARVDKGLPVDQRGQRGQLLREPHRQRGGRAARGEDEDGHRTGQGAHAAPAGQGRHRQRQGRLPVLQEDFSGPRWEPLARKNAQTQRVLWASTGTKNPSYRDTDLRRGADRGPHRQHRAPRHLQRLPRPRQAAAEPGGGRDGRDGRARRPREVGHLAEEGHRRPARGRPGQVRGPVREAPQGGRAPLPRRQQGAHQRADLLPARSRWPPRSRRS